MTERTTTEQATGGQPDLIMYRANHMAIRRSNDRLVLRLSREPIAADRESLPALARWYAGYAAELRHHHHVEDEIFFPALAERVPAAVALQAQMESDHVRLDELIDALGAALDFLSRPSTRSARDHHEAFCAAVELRAFISAHLAIEDRDIVPLFETNFSGDEYAALNARVVETIDKKQAFFTAPWLLSNVDAPTAERILAEAPLALRIVHRLARRKHARLTLVAFGRALATGSTS